MISKMDYVTNHFNIYTYQYRNKKNINIYVLIDNRLKALNNVLKDIIKDNLKRTKLIEGIWEKLIGIGTSMKSKWTIDFIDEYITSVLNDVKLSLIKSNFDEDLLKNYSSSVDTINKDNGIIKNKEQILKYINIFENMKVSRKYDINTIMNTEEYKNANI